ncbi:MAG: HlyC/CorC family transporter [Betaproteobacteria bacterium]|nr:HlyC/CorC family transporter [Betaproteobacteria bacterium]
MELLLIAGLTLLNGFFAMAEMALSSSRKARLVALDESGAAGARAALELMERPTQFLSTVQIGITSIGVLNGIVGEAAFSHGLGQVMLDAGWSPWAAAWVATAVVVTLITVITIIFGELVPKRIAQLHPETVARWCAPLMLALARLARPMVWLLSWATSGVLGLLRIDTRGSPSVTEEEITASLNQGVDAGLIELHEHQMVKNVFHLDERNLTSMMVPRADIAWLDARASVAQALAQIRLIGIHSWYPVCRDGLDHVLGAISVGQLLDPTLAPDLLLETLVQPVPFVPETLTGLDLLAQFRRPTNLVAGPGWRDHSQGRLTLVVDEYGVVQGMMTPRDVLEAITGELLHNSAPEETWATQRADGTWLLDGLMPISELKTRLQLKDLPHEDKGRYNTVAGLVLVLAGRLPRTGEVFEGAGWSFEVLDMDGRRIDKVWARPLPDSDHTG